MRTTTTTMMMIWIWIKLDLRGRHHIGSTFVSVFSFGLLESDGVTLFLDWHQKRRLGRVSFGKGGISPPIFH
jgi:hypothetical protein